MLRHLHREPGFYKRLFYLALPLILQNLITTSLGFVDTFMVGMLGQNELSAVTAANTPIYMLQIIILGLLSGLSVLASQYWGKGDTESINRCMGVSLYAGLIIAVSVAVVLFFFPLQVMALVTNNGLLIELGAPYLRIVGLSYIFNTISSVYIGMQRSTENPAMGMIVFGISMLTNTCLNYILIFGKLGAPALGITGAAIATLISRVVEVIMVLCYAPHYHRVPLMPRLLLRPYRDADAADLYAYSRDPRVGVIAGWQPHRSEEESLRFLRTVFSAPDVFALELRESGRAVGSIGFVGGHPAGEHPGCPDDEIGYALSPAHWGRGLMPEAMAAVLAYGFGPKGLARIWCSHYAGNWRSARVITKCGFRYAFARTEHVADFGEDRQTYFYVLTKEGWRERVSGAL